MKEEIVEQTTRPAADDRNAANTAENHNALVQRMYSGGMYPSTTPAYTHNDVMAMQYAWYNAYVQQSMYAQQSAYLAPYYAGHPSTATMPTCSTPPHTAQRAATDAADKLDNGRLQAKSSSAKDSERYEPYARHSTSAPVSPSQHEAAKAAPAYPAFAPVVAPAQYGSADTVHVTEAPVDLSQKTQKLQFLSTLKHLIDKQDKRDKANVTNGNKVIDSTVKDTQSTTGDAQNLTQTNQNKPNDNIKPNTSIAPTTTRCADSKPASSAHLKGAPANGSDVSKNLSSTEDKRAYIAVLRELFEKGHSRTSEQILAKKKNSEARPTASVNRKRSLDTSDDNDVNIKRATPTPVNHSLDTATSEHTAATTATRRLSDSGIDSGVSSMDSTLNHSSTRTGHDDDVTNGESHSSSVTSSQQLIVTSSDHKTLVQL